MPKPEDFVLEAFYHANSKWRCQCRAIILFTTRRRAGQPDATASVGPQAVRTSTRVYLTRVLCHLEHPS